MARNKGPRLEAVRARVIERRLDDKRLRIQPEQKKRMMHGKGTGIVIRMAALEWMGEDHLRPLLADDSRDGARQQRQVPARLLIGDAQALAANVGQAGGVQDIRKLQRARPAVVGQRCKAMVSAVQFVARSPIRHVDQVCAGEIREPRAKGDGLVIRVSKDKQRAWDRSRCGAYRSLKNIELRLIRKHRGPFDRKCYLPYR